jgi:NADH-quinone oxidoreductase subunit E
MAIEFSENAKKELAARVKTLPDKHSLVIPALHVAQREFGFISPEVMELVSSETGAPVSEVKAVATFYTMFNKKPVGRFHIQVCQNLTCSMLGSESIISCLERKLEIRCGETTADNMFTISRVECLGSCGTAPVMQINDTYYENLTFEKVDEIIENYKKELIKE